MEADVSSSSNLTKIKATSPLIDDAYSSIFQEGNHNIVKASALVRAPLGSVVVFLFKEVRGQEDVFSFRSSSYTARFARLDAGHGAHPDFDGGGQHARTQSHRKSKRPLLTTPLGNEISAHILQQGHSPQLSAPAARQRRSHHSNQIHWTSCECKARPHRHRHRYAANSVFFDYPSHHSLHFLGNV